MGASADEIDRQIKETRDHMDENLEALEARAASNATRYGRIAAIVIAGVAVAGASVLIYRRLRRPSRREQVRSLLEALQDLPDEVLAQLKKPLPSVKVVVNGERDLAEEPSTVERIVRRVAPAVVGSASSALLGRLTRNSDRDGETRSTIPAYD
jgi:hypothetical protein